MTHELLRLNQHKPKDEKAGPHLHPSPSFFIYFILFINIWPCRVFIAACNLSLLSASEGYSLVEVHRLFIVVAFLSLSFFQVASLVAVHRLYAHGL